MTWFAFIGLLVMTIIQVGGLLVFPLTWSRSGADAGTIVVRTLVHLLVLAVMVTSMILIGGLL